MHSRVIRGEILASSSLSAVSREAEAFFFRLILLADDYGRMDGRVMLVASHAYPCRTVTHDEIEAWLDELRHADGYCGPIVRYEVDGKPLIQLTNWENYRGKSRRASSSKYPPPPDDPGMSEDVRGDPPRCKGVRGKVYGVVGKGYGGRVREGGEARAVPPERPLHAPASEPAAKAASRSVKPRATDFPKDTTSLLAGLEKWASSRPEYAGLNLPECIETVQDWAISNGKLKHDWIRTCQSAIREGWGRKTTGNGPVQNDSEKPETLGARWARLETERQEREDGSESNGPQ